MNCQPMKDIQVHLKTRQVSCLLQARVDIINFIKVYFNSFFSLKTYPSSTLHSIFKPESERLYSICARKLGINPKIIVFPCICTQQVSGAWRST